MAAEKKDDNFLEDTMELIQQEVDGKLEVSPNGPHSKAGRERLVKDIMEGVLVNLQEHGRYPITYERKGEKDDKYIHRITQDIGDGVLPERGEYGSGDYYLPDGTERVVVAPFGHCCPNCGNCEALISFMRPSTEKELEKDSEGWQVISTLYRNFG